MRRRMNSSSQEYLFRPKMKLLKLFLILLFFVVPCIVAAQSELDEAEELYIGQTKIFSVEKPTRAAVGNPAIADVINVSDNSVTLAAKGVGTTTFILWDVSGERSYRIRVLAEEMNETKRRIEKLLKELNLSRVYIKTNNEEGKVLLLGEVNTKEEKKRIDLALGPLKEKTIDLIEIKDEGIVEIEVQLLELDRDATKTLGFEWPGSFTLTDVSGPTTTAAPATGLSAIFHVSDWTRTAFTNTLNFLIQEGKARVLSQPKLSCLSGKEAELLVGGEKPIFTTAVQATGSSSTSVEYKEYGIKLNIKPIISADDKIHIALNVDVSEVGAAEFIGLSTAPSAKAWPLTKRSVSTELYLNDNQTLAIGGLIRQKKEEDIRKTAGLGDIPILGALFRKKTTTVGGGQGERGDIELFITLTPKIVAKAKPLVVPEAAEVGDNIPEPLKDYIKDIQARILSAVYYPMDAKELGWEGTVKLSLLIAADGKLEDIYVAKSSGHRILDLAAMDAVKKQAPFPSFPLQATQYEILIEVPITYRKNNN
jgi:pilus assembly protein CpaC